MKRFLIFAVILFVVGFIGCTSTDDNGDPTGPTIDPPTGLTVEAESFNRVLVNWSYASDEATFLLERTDSGEEGWKVHVELPAGIKTFTDETNVFEGITYQYRVTADLGGKASDPSDPASTTTPPMPPTDLAAEAVTTTSVNLTWTDVSKVREGYELQRKLASEENSEYETITTTGKNVESYEDTVVVANNAYDYRLRATFDELFSSWSEKATATTLTLPAGLSATVISDSEIELSWSDAGTAYRLERKEIDADSWQTAAEPEAGVTGYTDTGLNEATAYQYRLFTVFVDEVSDPSDVLTEITIPKAPSNFSVAQEEDTPTTINISWVDESDKEARYELQRREGTEGDLQNHRTLNTDDESFSDISLDANQSYYYRISAVAQVIDEEGNTVDVRSVWSDIAGATTTVLTPTPPPTDFSGEAADYTQIDLCWTDNSENELGFVIERGLSRFGEYSHLASIPTDVIVYSDSGLDELTQYFYRIYAYNEHGNSVISNIVDVTTPEGPPAAVENFRIVQFDYRLVDIAWDDAAHNEFGFIIEKSISTPDDWHVLVTLPVDTLNGAGYYRDLEIEQLTTYSYKMYTYNMAGNSECSQVIEVTTLMEPPNAPDGLRINGTPNLVRIPLMWNDHSEDEEGFVIHRRAVPSWEYYEIGTVLADVVLFSDRYVEGSTEYGYKVGAYNESGANFSGELRVTTPPVPPQAPVDLRGETTSIDEVDLFWHYADFNDIIEFYDVERRDELDGDFIFLAQVVGFDNTFYHDTGLEPNEHTYWYQVMAVNDGGNSPYSNIAVVTTPMLEAPTNLVVITSDITALRLDWDYNYDVNFLIERKDDEDADFSFCAEANTNFYIDEDLEPDSVRYWYRVKAVIGEDESDWSNEASGATPFTIQFEDGFEDWEVGQPPGDPWVYNQGGDSYCEVTDEDLHRGDKSLHFVDPDPDVAANTANIWVVTEPIPTGEFTFWMKATPGGYFGWRAMTIDENGTINWEFLMQLNEDGSMTSNNGNQYAVVNGNWDTEEWFEVSCTWGDGSFSIFFDDEVIVNNWGQVFGLPPNLFWFLTFSGVGAGMENAWVDEVLIQYDLPDDDRLGPIRDVNTTGLPGDPFSTRAIMLDR